MTDLIILSLDVVERKLDYIFGKYVAEKKEIKEEKRGDLKKSNLFEKKNVKSRSKYESKAYFPGKIDLLKIFSIRIGKRVRKLNVSDLNIILNKIKEKEREKKEKIKLELGVKIFNLVLKRILSAISRFKRIMFWDIVRKNNRIEVVSGFLHILYLSSENKVDLYQKELFDDIEIRRKE